MSTYNAKVQRACSSRCSLLDREEMAAADPEQLAAIGREQATGSTSGAARARTQPLHHRRKPPGDTDDHPDGAGGARAADPRRTERLISSVRSSQRRSHPALTDDEPGACSEFVERLADDGSAPGVAIAPHGGAIKEWTDRQAEHVASQLRQRARRASITRAGGRTARLRAWHLHPWISTKASFPLLNSIIVAGPPAPFLSSASPTTGY